jgi:hypothetical protein
MLPKTVKFFQNISFLFQNKRKRNLFPMYIHINHAKKESFINVKFILSIIHSKFQEMLRFENSNSGMQLY